MKNLVIFLAFLVAVLGLCPSTAQADTITVNTLDDDGNGLDGDCNLREALLAANGNIGVDDCAVGNGADEIDLSGLTGTISLLNALPQVTDPLTITGPGAGVLTIDGGQHESIFQFNSPTNNRTFTVSGLKLTNGRGSDGGGAIYVSVGETLTVSRCLITGNSNGGKGRGGGIAVEGATLVLTDSTVSDNESISTGGGVDVFNAGAKATIRNSTISGNRALDVGDGVNPGAGAGGGVSCQADCTLDIVNSTVSDNMAVVEGGGIANDGTVRLRNATMTDNTAGVDGGGIFNDGAGTLKNTIVAGNTDTGGETPDCAGALTSEDFNLIGDASGCTIGGTVTNNVTGNPFLDELAGNGGSTQTHALLAASPALDAGDPGGCVDENGDPLTADQRGFARPVGAACDIGAFEVGGCGDGAVDAAKGEECDDANTNDTDDCRNDCTLPPAGTTGGTTTGGGTTGGDDAGGGCSLVHNVSNAAGFQNALLTARSNGDDDVINLAAGTYKVSQNGGNPFRYVGDVGENFSLTIVGAGAGTTILDGELSVRVMDADTTGVVGGGTDADVSIQGVTFRQGKRTGSGGGLFVRTTDADVSLSNSVFELNTAVAGGSDPFDGSGGGAAFLTDGNGNVDVSGSIFFDNEAKGGGGLVVVTVNGSGSVRDCVMDSNSAEAVGGVGMVGFSGRIVFSNNLVRRNISLVADGGGGAALQSNSQPVDVIHNTFYDNVAPRGGGLIVGGEDEVNLFNNLFAENSASAGSGADIFVLETTPAPVVSLFNNIFSEFCVENGSCDPADLGGTQGGNLIDIDPLLADPANGDFHLLAGSPAINAGSPDASSLPAGDFEGDARVQGSAPDVGADETDACGNGVVETGEDCDDGNTVDSDGCSASCLTEAGGTTGGTDGNGGGCSLIREVK